MRAAGQPVTVLATLTASRFKISGGSVLAISELEASASLDADRLVDAARKPWAVAFDARVVGFRQPAIRMASGRLTIDGTLGDVRRAGLCQRT